MVDGGFLSERSDSKNMAEISHSIDSLSFRADSIGRSMFNEIKLSIYSPQSLSKTDSIKVVKKELPSIINGDSVFNTYTLAEKEEALANAYNQTNKLASDWGVKSIQVTDTDKNILRHKNHLVFKLPDVLFHRSTFRSHHPKRWDWTSRSYLRRYFCSILHHRFRLYPSGPKR